MMIGGITQIMIVFVMPLTWRPDVPTIDTRQGVGVRAMTGSNLDVDSLPRLLPIAVSRWLGGWPGAACDRIIPVWHQEGYLRISHQNSCSFAVSDGTSAGSISPSYISSR